MKLLTMPLPAGSPCCSASPLPAGVEDGGRGSPLAHRGLSAVLDPFVYEDQRWCGNCAGEQMFVEVFETEFGRVGYCVGCGEERVVRFTRTCA